LLCIVVVNFLLSALQLIVILLLLLFGILLFLVVSYSVGHGVNRRAVGCESVFAVVSLCLFVLLTFLSTTRVHHFGTYLHI
jgi:hypothetical protein